MKNVIKANFQYESAPNKAPHYDVGIRNPHNPRDYRPLAHMEATEVKIWFTEGLHESLREQVGKKMLTWEISESEVAKEIREKLAQQKNLDDYSI